MIMNACLQWNPVYDLNDPSLLVQEFIETLDEYLRYVEEEGALGE